MIAGKACWYCLLVPIVSAVLWLSPIWFTVFGAGQAAEIASQGVRRLSLDLALFLLTVFGGRWFRQRNDSMYIVCCSGHVLKQELQKTRFPKLFASLSRSMWVSEVCQCLLYCSWIAVTVETDKDWTKLGVGIRRNPSENQFLRRNPSDSFSGLYKARNQKKHTFYV